MAKPTAVTPVEVKAARPPTPFVTTLYQYPLGNWIENIAVRASGELLLTLLNTPHVDQIDPSLTNPTPVHVHDFAGVPKAASVFGIAEIDPDVFAVAVGNYSMKTGAEPGSWGVWRLDLKENDADKGPEAHVRLIADMPEALLLNGMSSLPGSSRGGRSPTADTADLERPSDILVGDLQQGLIYHVDTVTGSYHVAINDTLTVAEPKQPFTNLVGVNGMHTDPADDSNLYFANTGQDIFAKVAIDRATGAATGKAEVVASIMDANTMQYDDFAIRGNDVYLVTGSGNSIEQLCLADGKPRGRVILAGNLNSTEIAEPTACAFGRTPADAHVLYVVTAGGLASPINGTVTVGAQVLALDTRMWEEYCIY
ncbi:hypothetical protein PG991_013922 [Apiospora marii]|uniref:SMP-30/Gluconolactonase/LRE-like region domain-containing protein n=1 Tax=Apiospora marii TaxID=335849 RepID=A0ABR1R7C8_9PEZI